MDLKTAPAGQALDVVHYDLDLRLAMTDAGLEGTAGITFVLLAPTDSVRLDAAALQFTGVTSNGVATIYRFDTGETAIVGLGTMHAAGDTIRLGIRYSRPTSLARPSSRQGYYFFLDTIGLPANLGYTMSEPSDAHYWFPCFDRPDDKATASIRATVPAGYIAASNGKLVDTTVNGDGTVTWHWEESHQIATYLMCVTASSFAISTIPFARAPNDTIPLQYYTWTPDAPAAAGFLPTVRQMMKVLSRLYGPYPFDKYGMTAVVPFAYGGMEHQSLTTLNRYYLADERVVVHELGHQWWGDLVTCGTWADVWLNESFATYSEALWQESNGGPTALRNYMQNNLLHFNLGSWQGAVYDPVAQGYNLFSDLVYSKGAWVLHTLRGVLGDSLFFSALAAYRQAFSGGSATTVDFANIVSAVAGRPMDRFFNQWIFGAGWPKLTTSASWSEGFVHLVIAQTQPSAWPVYQLPLTVRTRMGTADSTNFTIVDSLRVQSFSFPMAVQPVSVVVDPDGWVLKEIFGNAAGSQVPTTLLLRPNYPNPFNATTWIRYGLPVPGYVTLVVYDLLGRKVLTLVDGQEPAGEREAVFDGSALASGVYVYRLEVRGGSAFQGASGKMILLR